MLHHRLGRSRHPSTRIAHLATTAIGEAMTSDRVQLGATRGQQVATRLCVGSRESEPMGARAQGQREQAMFSRGSWLPVLAYVAACVDSLQPPVDIMPVPPFKKETRTVRRAIRK